MTNPHDKAVEAAAKAVKRKLMEVGRGGPDATYEAIAREDIPALLYALEAANKRADEAEAAGVTDDQIDHMVDRFLNWKLPENFNPDGGISFQKTTNENTPWPHKSEPVGTNLFDAQQAKAMVLHMVEGLHCKPHNEHAADEARALSARLEAEKKRAEEAEALFASGDKLRNDALLELSEYERENDTLRAEVERLREVLWAAQSEYDQMIWGEDSEYLEAGNRVQQIIDAALKGNTNDEG